MLHGAPFGGGIFRPIRVFSGDGCEAYTRATLTGTTAGTQPSNLPRLRRAEMKTERIKPTAGRKKQGEQDNDQGYGDKASCRRR